MEKINKEELIQKLNLTEEELDKVVGGSGIIWDKKVECIYGCINSKQNKDVLNCINNCNN